MFILLGTQKEGIPHVLARNGSFVIWDLDIGLDDLNAPDLPPLHWGEWYTFEEGDFKKWSHPIPNTLEVILCRIDQEYINQLGYQAWPWLRFPLVALLGSDDFDRKDFDLIPAAIFEPEAN